MLNLDPFKANGFCLNKRHFIQFTSNISLQIDLDITFTYKLVSTFHGTEFLETYLHSTLSGKINFEQIEHK